MISAMKTVLVTSIAAAALSFAGVIFAQTDPKLGASVTDPPGPIPDPSHVPIVLPKDIKCNGTAGSTSGGPAISPSRISMTRTATPM
jgi:hypothetical protein